MSDPANKERHSAPIRTESAKPLTDEQKALQEALNTLLQYDRMSELINESLAKPGTFRLRMSDLLELNRISIQKIEADAGRLRVVPMGIEYSNHQPPSGDEVPRYLDEMCDYVNENWHNKSALHLSAFVMWRLNWIHPFIDGNGRTTRAVSYWVLCAKLGFRIPGVTTIPELISKRKGPYYDALEAADEALAKGKIDVSRMEELLRTLLFAQMVEVVDRGDQSAAASGTNPPSAASVIRKSSDSENITVLRPAYSVKTGSLFGGFALAFFMALVIMSIYGRSVPPNAKFLVVIVMALSAGLSTGYFGGNASAKGSIPIPGAEDHPLRYGVTGGIAVFVILLILGRVLFM